jgi:DNA-directed RNA polymerase specialized sigma24 family protein
MNVSHAQCGIDAKRMDYICKSLKEVFPAEITGIVEKPLRALPSQTRCIFGMSRYEHLPVKETARLLSLSPKSEVRG